MPNLSPSDPSPYLSFHRSSTQDKFSSGNLGYSSLNPENYIELSETELEDISGGLDVNLTYAFGQESMSSSTQNIVMDNGSQLSSTSCTSQSYFFGFQLNASFDSKRHFYDFKSRLDSFFQHLGFW